MAVASTRPGRADPSPPAAIWTELDPFGAGVDVEPLATEEAHQGHPELAGQRHRQTARRRHGADHRHTSYQRLLQNLVAGPPTDHQQVLVKRQSSLEERPPEQLVDRVVA